MKVIFLLLFSSVISFASFAIDLTITLTSIPSNTPVSDQIYICGSFNNWAVGSANSILQVQTNGTRKITLTNVSGTIEFKFNRGNWDTPEGTAQGGFVPNRTYNTANGSSLNLTIAGWEDLPASGTSTANGNVQILSTNFIPTWEEAHSIPPLSASTMDAFLVIRFNGFPSLITINFKGSRKST